ncbi:MAG: hypothetical protein KDB69_03610 [Acidimicrobiia bacterium]|nr:hypothetical protein [Acidimicrobiia bacterium]
MIILTVAAVIALIGYLVSRDTEQRTASEFYVTAESVARLHAEAADELEGALAAIGIASRPDFEARLERMMAKATEADGLLDVDVVPSIAAAYGSITTASSVWLEGVNQLEATMTGMLEASSDGDTARIRMGMDLLRAGDAAYRTFLSTIEGVDTGATSFEPVAYVRTDVQDPLLYDPLTISIRIQTSYDLAPHHNVSVRGQTDPEPVGDRAGIPLLPFTDSVTVQAIVTNDGNELETGVTVELTVFDGELNTSETFTETIAELPAGGSTSVGFFGLPLVPERLYQLTLTATIADDSMPNDNTWLMTVIQNEAG